MNSGAQVQVGGLTQQLQRMRTSALNCHLLCYKKPCNKKGTGSFWSIGVVVKVKCACAKFPFASLAFGTKHWISALPSVCLGRASLAPKKRSLFIVVWRHLCQSCPASCGQKRAHFIGQDTLGGFPPKIAYKFLACVAGDQQSFTQNWAPYRDVSK